MDSLGLSLLEAGLKPEQVIFLNQRKIHTLGDLTSHTTAEIKAKGVVRRRLGFLRKLLGKHGLCFKGDVVAQEAGARGQSFTAGVVAFQQSGDNRALDTLVRENDAMAWWHARWYLAAINDPKFDPAMELEDFHQEALGGLLRGVAKFDPTMGNQFSTYAYHWMRQATSRAMMNSGRVRIPVHVWPEIADYIRVERRMFKETGHWPHGGEVNESLGWDQRKLQRVLAALTWQRAHVLRVRYALGNDVYDKRLTEEALAEGVVGDGPGGLRATSAAAQYTNKPQDVESIVLARRTLDRIFEIANLTDREREILVMRYGLDGMGERTLQQVGDKLNVTRERIRQLEAMALRTLHNAASSESLRPPKKRKDEGQKGSGRVVPKHRRQQPHRSAKLPNDASLPLEITGFIADETDTDANTTPRRQHTPPIPIEQEMEHLPVDRAAAVLWAVTDFYGTSPEILLDDSDDGYLTEQRQVAMHILQQDFGLTHGQLAELRLARDAGEARGQLDQIEARIARSTYLHIDLKIIRRRLQETSHAG
ncbi:MAG: hypothetical protein COU35_05230 [Candidatus Magasanikbacteria bacterium CG10_big_fil_rev_8_21_14_0_10_47_10]|uniref:RNA polymerase sigma-70 domain-containing protein n=1 Tax=Candidatus Magasanikbacteria bacterium CG10_big_fil_rev_8_21_14_0_10_47_10 TaxID=1974652 RepID=A0A2H0TR54_9BACT|nr:MAG: hypothetical protein COU35_05230 [Candidatus Magasanikbacteria bacterium CG10_big_fil_rev_8_21_14_0_10_47_10]